MPVRLWWGDREVRSSWGMDVFLRAEARGRGLGARLFTAWSDHVEVALGPGPHAVLLRPLQEARLPRRGAGPLLPEGPGPARRWRARRVGPALGAAAGPILGLAWRALHPEAPARETGIEVRTVTGFGAEYDTLWERARASYAMCVRRDAAYLEWKYARCPHRRYALREARREGKLLGFAVSRHEDYRGLRLGWIVDVFARADDHDAKDALIGAVLDVLPRGRGGARAGLQPERRAPGGPARGAGSRPDARPCSSACAPRVPSEDVFEDVGRWHVVFGDSDMDR